jgi:hypothetical protein
MKTPIARDTVVEAARYGIRASINLARPWSIPGQAPSMEMRLRHPTQVSLYMIPQFIGKKLQDLPVLLMDRGNLKY